MRSYYNNHGGWSKKFNPISYLISGSDVEAFDAKYGKAIGVSKSQAPFDGRQKKSAELNEAVRNYAIGGLRFVTDKHKGIYDSTGIGYALHTKFQTIRNKNGKIKGYEFVDLKFCPEEGPENPFVRVGLIKP